MQDLGEWNGFESVGRQRALRIEVDGDEVPEDDVVE